MFTKINIAICIAVIVVTASAIAKDQDVHRDQAGAARASSRLPIQPYGTDAEVQQCVGNMEAPLRGRSIFGSRDTAAYIQDRGNLDDMGLTEYDVLVGRCMNKFFHRHIGLNGRQPR